MKGEEIQRRVYRAEMQRLLGCGGTWLRVLEQKGRIPPGRVDPGGKRRWWTLDEAKRIVEGRTEEAA